MEWTHKQAAHLELLEAAIKQTVYGLCCKWNILAEFITTGLFQEAYRKSSGLSKSITNSYLYVRGKNQFFLK